MDIERISYIFGSFARRRQSQEFGSLIKRKSIESSKISHDRSRSSPIIASKIAHSKENLRAKSVIANTITSAYEEEGEKKNTKCEICNNVFDEPKVLSCLHTFCLNCLRNLEKNNYTPIWSSEENLGTNKLFNHSDGICCPTCKVHSKIPPNGVDFFPPNYSIQHHIVLKTLNSKLTHLLCDLCTKDITATSRCMDCALNFCKLCEKIHLREKSTNLHEILSLDEARVKGITKIRKQVMCMLHKHLELKLFCSTCYEVVCQECVSINHRNHLCESIKKVAKPHLNSLRMVSNKAKALIEKSAIDTNSLNANSKKIELHCGKIQSDVEKFIEDYIKTIEQHKLMLLEQIKRIKEEKVRQIFDEKLRLQKKVKDAREIANFLDDLLPGCSNVEILSFMKPIIDKIETCGNLEPSPQLKYAESVQFLPDEVVKISEQPFNIYGVLTTQSVSAEHCHIIETQSLHNLRVGKQVEITLQTKDNKEHPLERGGDWISAEIRHRDAGVLRSIPVNVLDEKNGSYSISFIPDIAGKLILIIKINDEHIQGSPFPISIRSLKPHFGIYHCCSFCSSGGNKETICGCEGRMPGGYKGCGHGHDGHPGKRHWNCCGNILEHSECGRSRSNSQYQFSL